MSRSSVGREFKVSYRDRESTSECSPNVDVLNDFGQVRYCLTCPKASRTRRLERVCGQPSGFTMCTVAERSLPRRPAAAQRDIFTVGSVVGIAFVVGQRDIASDDERAILAAADRNVGHSEFLEKVCFRRSVFSLGA